MSWALILLSVYLIIVGLQGVTNVTIVWANVIAGFAAVISGVMILYNKRL